MVEKFQAELPRVLAYLRFPMPWRHSLRTTNLAEGFFKHLRRYLGRFPGCVDKAHREQVLGCYFLAAEHERPALLTALPITSPKGLL